MKNERERQTKMRNKAMKLQDKARIQCTQQKIEVSNLEDQLSKQLVYMYLSLLQKAVTK